MTSPSILIYGTCFVRSAAARELLKLWGQCIDTLNPDCDVVLVDAPSPYGAHKIFPEWGWQQEGYFNPAADPERLGLTRLQIAADENSARRFVWSFTENAGHLNENGRDGAGRAFMQGMILAMGAGYDYCVHVEGDLLMTKPIRPWVERMHRHSINVAAPFDSYYQFGEWGLSFFNVNWLRESKFVERYDWANQTGLPIPELAIETLVGDEFFTLPIRGMRNDFHQVNRQTVVSGFPYGFDYITHCYRDFETYRALMRRNGLEPKS